MPKGGGGGRGGGGSRSGGGGGGRGGGASTSYGWSWGSSKSWGSSSSSSSSSSGRGGGVGKKTEVVTETTIPLHYGYNWSEFQYNNEQAAAQVHREAASAKRTPLNHRLGTLDWGVLAVGTAGALAVAAMLIHPSGRAALVKRWQQFSASMVRAGNKAHKVQGYSDNKL